MISAQIILAAATRLARDWAPLAAGWHAYFGAVAIALVLGWRPEAALAGDLLALPLFSVAALAAMNDNPFTTGVVGAAAVALVAIGNGSRRARLSFAPSAWRPAGIALAALGLAYPHFLEDGTFLRYAYEAPCGVLPCPTLLVVVGCALVAGCAFSRSWRWVVAATGLLYGLVGALFLHVALDWLLVAGSLALAAQAFAGRTLQVPVDRSQSTLAGRS